MSLNNSSLTQAIEEMRNMRESYNQLAGAAEAYNEGKPALAEAITAKGVEAAATDSLATMAEKVMTISQDTYEIDGGEMYAKQLFGSLTTPNYWNLYEVLANLLSDGRLVNYGGILLAEYYKGYDSLALSGAGAGGAYVVSDMENGQFKMYTEDTTHTWATEDDGKGNRWVAYCFADEAHGFQITNTSTSPRTIHIGRHVGVVESLVAGRVSELVVTDGNILDDFRGSFTQYWGQRVVVRNTKHSAGNMFYNASIEKLYIQSPQISGGAIYTVTADNNIDSIVIDCDDFSGNIFSTPVGGSRKTNVKTLLIKSPNCRCYINNGEQVVIQQLSSLYLNIKGSVYFKPGGGANPTSLKVYVAMGGYEKTSTTALINVSGTPWTCVSDLLLESGYCRNLNIASCTSLTEANMYAHILQRLKQDEADCGDDVTITLGSTNLAKLTSDESIALLDELTNTYGYTFA